MEQGHSGRRFALPSVCAWRIGGTDGPRHLVLSRPYVMGILNVTPDSFSDGGQHDSFEKAVAFAMEMVADGADIIDVGGESTRPGSSEVSVEEELSRVLPVVLELASRGVIVSIDTRHPEVAARCVESGAAIINDISGFSDSAMVDVAAGCDAGLITMHMLGTPETMQDDPHYDDVLVEISADLLESAGRLERAGVDPSRICIDPGPGFGKNAWHNMRILSGMETFSNLGYPLIAAFSRKATLGKVCGIEVASDRALPSEVASAIAYAGGARVFRVHDVAGTVQALQVASNSLLAQITDRSSSQATLGIPTMLPGKRALVALGSNMGDPAANIESALAAIDALDGVRVIASSSIYRTEPAYYDEQADFANSAAWVQTTLSPVELLDSLLAIEDDFHRERIIRNGPRTLDLDLLDYEGEVIRTEHLSIPHPRILERDFTVTPLMDLAVVMREKLGIYACDETIMNPCDLSGTNKALIRLADGTSVVRDGIEYGKVIQKIKDVEHVWR